MLAPKTAAENTEVEETEGMDLDSRYYYGIKILYLIFFMTINQKQELRLGFKY